MPAPNSFLNIAIAARTVAVIGLLAAPLTSYAQTTEGDAATITILREQVAALTRRLEEVERRQATQASVKSGGQRFMLRCGKPKRLLNRPGPQRPR